MNARSLLMSAASALTSLALVGCCDPPAGGPSPNAQPISACSCSATHLTVDFAKQTTQRQYVAVRSAAGQPVQWHAVSSGVPGALLDRPHDGALEVRAYDIDGIPVGPWVTCTEVSDALLQAAVPSPGCGQPVHLAPTEACVCYEAGAQQMVRVTFEAPIKEPKQELEIFYYDRSGRQVGRSEKTVASGEPMVEFEKAVAEAVKIQVFNYCHLEYVDASVCADCE